MEAGYAGRRGSGWALIARQREARKPNLLGRGLHSSRVASFGGFPGRRCIVTTLKVPKAGGLPTTKVNIVRWLKQEGEPVARGDAIVELETEKVSYELDSPAEGILLKILRKAGSDVPVGEAVCHIGQPGDTIPQE